jgi:hypothetical protein
MLPFFKFWLDCIREAWNHAWTVCGVVATAVALFIPFVLYIKPKWLTPMRQAAVTELIWQIPLTALVACFVVCLVLSPYWLYQRKSDELRNLKADSNLTMSVLWYRFNPITNELSADVQFVNKGTVRRTVLGVTLTHRSKDQNGQNLLIQGDDPYAANIYDSSAPPVYVEPNEPIVRKYKYTLKADEINLTRKPGEVFGLQVVTLKLDSSMNFTTVEAMIVSEYQIGEQKGTALGSTGRTNVSLDTSTYVKMENPIMQPLPTPNTEASPH